MSTKKLEELEIAVKWMSNRLGDLEAQERLRKVRAGQMRRASCVAGIFLGAIASAALGHSVFGDTDQFSLGILPGIGMGFTAVISAALAYQLSRGLVRYVKEGT